MSGAIVYGLCSYISVCGVLSTQSYTLKTVVRNSFRIHNTNVIKMTVSITLYSNNLSCFLKSCIAQTRG